MDDAAARKEKLRQLKERAQAKRKAEEAGVEDGAEQEGPLLKFRNYKPTGDDLQDGVIAKAAAVKKLEVEEEAPQDVKLDVAPKKINWDLKRDIQKKLDKLERRTQKAIMEMIKDKVKEGEGGGEGSEGAEQSGAALAAAVRSKGQ